MTNSRQEKPSNPSESAPARPERQNTPEQQTRPEQTQPQRPRGVPINFDSDRRPAISANEELRDSHNPPDQAEESPREETPEPSLPTPEESLTPEAPKSQSEQLAQEIIEHTEELKGQSIGELFTSLLSQIQEFAEKLKSFDFAKLLGGTAAAKFAAAEMDKIDLKPEENAETKYESQEKSAEYVCSVLGLPKRNTPAELLTSLINSGKVISEKREEVKTLESGDLVFFKKTAADTEPFLVAVVTKTEPVSVKTVPEGGGNPVEIPLETSQYFKDNWHGIVRTKQKTNE